MMGCLLWCVQKQRATLFSFKTFTIASLAHTHTWDSSTNREQRVFDCASALGDTATAQYKGCAESNGHC